MSRECVYHYCSTSTFLALLESNTIRLSSMRMSNDHLEGRWALDCLEKYASSDRDASEGDYLSPRITESIYNSFNVFAFCLSENGDSLSQWRGYADDGHGFSIGFVKEKIDDMLSSRHPTATLRKVQYSQGGFDASTYDIFQKYINELRSMIRNRRDIDTLIREATIGGMQDLFYPVSGNSTASIIRDLAVSLYIYKNPAFIEEAEWRIVKPQVQEDDLGFVAKRNMLVPFIEMPINSWKYMIDNIYLGPKNNSDLSSLKTFLNRKEIYCDLSRSSASYR